MKKLWLSAFRLLILVPIGLFLYSVHYQHPSGIWSFYTVITTEPAQDTALFISQIPDQM